MLSALRRHIRDGSFGPCLPSRRRRRGRSCWQRRCRCSRSGCRRRSLHGSCIQTSLAGSARVNSQAVLDTRGKMATDDDQFLGNTSRIYIYRCTYTYIYIILNLLILRAIAHTCIYTCIYIATALGSTTVCNLAGSRHKIHGLSQLCI